MEQIAPLQPAKPFARTFIFLSLVFLSIMFSVKIGILLIQNIYAVEIGADTNMLTLAQGSVEGVSAIKLLQFLQQLLGMVLPCLFFARLVNVDVGDELGLYNQTKVKTYLLATIFIFTVLPFINFTGWLNSLPDFSNMLGEVGRLIDKGEEDGKIITALLVDTSTPLAFAYTLLVMAIMPALGEELIFRGVLQKLFWGIFKNPHAGIWASAFIFSFIHFQFYGFLPRMILGAGFGYLYYFSRTLWVPIIAHAANNALAVVAMAWPAGNDAVLNADTVGTTSTAVDIILLIVSVAISVGLLYLIKKDNPTPPPPVVDEVLPE